MTAAAFIIGFLVLGLIVVAAAFSGSRRRDLDPAKGPGRSGRRATAAITLIISVAMGIAIPAVILLSSGDARSAPGGVKLTAAEERGRTTFAERCGQCHTLRAANAVGKVGPNLDTLRPPKALTLNAIQQGRARGQGQMPAGVVDGEDAQDVAEFIEAVAGR